MKWTYSIKNKVAASVVLFVLCLLVLLSNYLDRLHTENVKNSISTMYEDRLIVEEYILKMTRNTYQMREVLSNDKEQHLPDQIFKRLISDFRETYNSFIQTRLTKNEKITAEELIRQIRKFEQDVLNTSEASVSSTDPILLSLENLSAIQLAESKLIMKQVESQYAAIKASSQLTFAIVILILIVLQILVFSGESIIPLFKKNDPKLN